MTKIRVNFGPPEEWTHAVILDHDGGFGIAPDRTHQLYVVHLWDFSPNPGNVWYFDDHARAWAFARMLQLRPTALPPCCTFCLNLAGGNRFPRVNNQIAYTIWSIIPLLPGPLPYP